MAVTEIPNFDGTIFTSGYQSSSVDIKSSASYLPFFALGIRSMSLAKPTHQLSILNIPQCNIALIIAGDNTFEM